MEQQFTQEQIAQHINAAFDSVILVEELNALETLTEEQEATKARNVEHLRIMMGHEWFAAALTKTQTAHITKLI